MIMARGTEEAQVFICVWFQRVGGIFVGFSDIRAVLPRLGLGAGCFRESLEVQTEQRTSTFLGKLHFTFLNIKHGVSRIALRPKVGELQMDWPGSEDDSFRSLVPSGVRERWLGFTSFAHSSMMSLVRTGHRSVSPWDGYHLLLFLDLKRRKKLTLLTCVRTPLSQMAQALTFRRRKQFPSLARRSSKRLHLAASGVSYVARYPPDSCS